MTTFYIVLSADNKVIAECPTKTIPLDGLHYLAEGEIDLSFPIVEIRTSPLGSEYPWVIEDSTMLSSYSSLNDEMDALQTEIINEDFSSASTPKLRKVARYLQIQLKLAKGDF